MELNEQQLENLKTYMNVNDAQFEHIMNWIPEPDKPYGNIPCCDSGCGCCSSHCDEYWRLK